jgi:DNA polymerase-3 subunit gamma/tau
VDVVEIDGASNNKVDEARDLRSNVGFRPTRGRFKIYIIDEVHMLSNSAFNALLKTLEEPPSHVKFILATTEVQKIPITILSRCQRYDFATVGPAKILEALRHIAKQEGITADDEALRIVARRANGSMRDSQTLLEQLLGACDGVLTAEKVHALFGTAGDERVGELADAILDGDAKRAVELVGQSSAQGLQLGELLDQLVDYWRGMMLVSVGGADLESLPGSASVREKLTTHAAAVNLDAILAGIDILTGTKVKLRGSPHTQVLFEVAVLRLTRLSDLLSVSQLVQSLSGGAKLPAGGSSPKLATPGPAKPNAEAVKKKLVTAPEVKSEEMKVNGEWTATDFPIIWERVLEQVGPMLAAHLRQATDLQANFKPNSLAILFDSDYSSPCEMVRTDRNQDTLRRALRHVSGGEWAVRVDLKPNGPANGVGKATTAPAPLAPASHTHKGRNALLALPLFQAAQEVLGAQLMRVDDGFDPTPTPASTTDPESDPDAPIPAPTDPDET